MPILRSLTAALAWLGRQGTTALAVSIFLGLGVPPLAAYVKPHLAEIVFILLLFSYLRTDPSALRRYLRAPRHIVLASLWIMVALPIMLGALYVVVGLRDLSPALFTIMILHLAISPITSAAAFVALMGLDVAFALLTLILSNAITPLTTAAISYLFLGASLVSPVELGFKLLVFYLLAGTAAWALRRLLGQARIERYKEPIDGLNVIAVFLFAVAAMDGVTVHVMNDPLFALGLLVFVFVLAGVSAGLSILVFLRAGVELGTVTGLLACSRNLGVIMATIGATLPPVAWFYFALVQFPIYLFPALLRPLARRFAEKR